MAQRRVGEPRDHKRQQRDAARARRRWTKGEEAALQKRVRMGMYVEDIAVEHQRSAQGIEARITKLNIGPARHRPSSSKERTSVKTSGVQTAGTRTVATGATTPEAPSRKGFFGRLFKR